MKISVYMNSGEVLVYVLPKITTRKEADKFVFERFKNSNARQSPIGVKFESDIK